MQKERERESETIEVHHTDNGIAYQCQKSVTPAKYLQFNAIPPKELKMHFARFAIVFRQEAKRKQQAMGEKPEKIPYDSLAS